MTAKLEQLLIASPEEAAPQLLGSHLVSEIDGDLVRVRLTEVEAYKGSDDPASHAYRGETPRNSAMFQAPGTLYVYRSYGIHWCANTAAGPMGIGWGILMRSGQIVDGESTVIRRRGRYDQLANGPGKLTHALGITGEHNGLDLFDASSPIRLEPGDSAGLVMATPRIGISRAKDVPWRFIEARSAGNDG
ncbi:MAG TPA: DNA-3-methyladenine glycosylase [Acidimicrobiia bacterium]